MTVLFIFAVFILLIFSFVIFFGAPYLPTLKKRTSEALDLLDLRPGQTLLELGSGDGRILREAAKRGIHAVGYELNPMLVVWSVVANWKYRNLIKVHWKNYWRHELPKADGIYVFLLDKYMNKLDKLIIQKYTAKSVKYNGVSGHKLRLVSYAFEIPNKKPIKELNGLFLYEYQPHGEHFTTENK